MTSSAERSGEGFILNGEKRYITNVPLADWLVVYAKLEGRISAFLVSRQDQGCSFSYCRRFGRLPGQRHRQRYP